MMRSQYFPLHIALFRIIRAWLIGPRGNRYGCKKTFREQFKTRLQTKIAWNCAISEIKSFALSCAGYWSREYCVISDEHVWRRFSDSVECMENTEELRDKNCKKIFGVFVRKN